MFTGDASGAFLFRALYYSGFANQPSSVSREDGLVIKDMLISAVCRCAPPDNKPSRLEIANCLPYLEEEINLMINLQGSWHSVIGSIIPCLFIGENSPLEFKHAAIQTGEKLPDYRFLSPSQQNTPLRLTADMFDQICSQFIDCVNKYNCRVFPFELAGYNECYRRITMRMVDIIIKRDKGFSGKN
jgi:hypothetical protein